MGRCGWAGRVRARWGVGRWTPRGRWAGTWPRRATSGATGLDVDVPYLSGKLSTLGYLSPRIGRLLRPLLELRGAAAKKQYLARKGHG